MAEKTEKKTPTIPANAKKPQDRQTAKADVVKPAATVVTWHDHEYSVDADAFNDLEVLEYITEAQSNEQPQLFVLALKAVLGKTEYNRYKNNARGENGRVSVEDAGAFFSAIMEAANQGNS
jgi:hypothetical protein